MHMAEKHVADVAVLTLDDPRASNAVVEIGGPENLTLDQVVDVYERVTGRKGKRTHLPVWLMRALSVIVRPFNPVFARQVQAGSLMATTPTPFDPALMLARYPVRLVRLEELVRRRYARRRVYLVDLSVSVRRNATTARSASSSSSRLPSGLLCA